MFEHYVNGLLYGYPKCCIAEFLYTLKNNIRLDERKLSGTGYIPCVNCDINYSEVYLINKINKHRNKSYPIFKKI